MDFLSLPEEVHSYRKSIDRLVKELLTELEAIVGCFEVDDVQDVEACTD